MAAYSKILVALLALVFVLSGCPANPGTNGPANGNRETKTPTPAENVSSTQTPAKENKNTSGSLATPADAFRTACEMRQRKDTAALRRVLSKDALEFFTEIGKVQNKSLDEMLQDLVEKPEGPCNEYRNEHITGNRAVLEYKDENGEWKEMDFEKENGEWKLTVPKADSPGKNTGRGPKKL